MIDGIPFNPPTGTSVDYSQLPTFGVDRIEVLPGPYSALYGSQALGGVINIITKEPTKEEFQGEVSAGRSAYGSDIDKVNLAYRNVTSYGLGYTIDFGYSGSTGFHDTPATVSANPFYTGPAPISATGAIPIPGSPGTYIIGDTGSTPWYELKSGVRLYYNVDANTKITAGVAYSQSELEFGEGPNSYLTTPQGRRFITVPHNCQMAIFCSLQETILSRPTRWCKTRFSAISLRESRFSVPIRRCKPRSMTFLSKAL